MTPGQRYGTAVLSVVVATLAGIGIDYFLQVGRLPSALYLPAVLVATAVGGQGPGIAAMVLGPLAGELARPHPHRSVAAAGSEIVGLALFLAVGAGVTVLAGRLARARAEAVEAAAQARRRTAELMAVQERAERLARAAEQRSRDFATLFDTAPIGIGIAEDPACAHIRPNRAFAEMLGVDPAQNISQTAGVHERLALNIMTPEGTALSHDELTMQRAARTGLPVSGVDLDIVRADGTRLSLLEFAAPLFDDEGRPRGAIGAFLDVSRRRRASEAQRFLGDATHLLTGSLNHEATLAQLARLAVPEMADWSVLDMVNDQGIAVRMGQAHRDPALQALMDERLALASAGHQEARAPGRLADIVARGRPLLLARTSPEALAELGYTPAQRDVAARYGLASLMMLPIVVGGRVEGGFGWMRDGRRPRFDEDDLALAEEVARRASSAIEKARLYREAQTANRLKDEFVATLSHELRTPLNALLGWIELLRSGRLSPDRAHQALEAVERTARLQAQITNDLVDVSKAVSGKFRLAPRPVDAGEVARNVGDAFRLAAEARFVRLTVTIPPGLPRVLVDPDRLQQIVYNLVGNAVKFTASGSVDVSAGSSNGWLELTVRDTGIGIRPEFLPHVFDRFRQADGSVTRKFGGLGLGLSIVRALVELHGGTVAAHSEGEGRGATFSVRLPVAAALAPARDVVSAMRLP
jgi:signal transduction histidine kinase